MRPYTVLLRAPDWLTSHADEIVFLLHVMGENAAHAIRAAQRRAFDESDLEAWEREEYHPMSFSAIFVCHGHHANLIGN